MKKAIIITLISIFSVSGLMAQSQIDRLFGKYQGREGFVTVTVSGNLLRLAAALDHDSGDPVMKHASKLTSVRILAKEDDLVESENFYDLVIDDLLAGGYEEMMTVNSTDTDVRMLLKADGDIFREFILVVGGSVDNAIIQIKGNLTYEDIHEIGSSVNKGEGIHAINMFD
ncbi:MAG: DUF4252 domain-containing protein [Bacteroidales bacterium]|nr:DUF4252 domain-containing protein [Bacteroidales bacterium]